MGDLTARKIILAYWRHDPVIPAEIGPYVVELRDLCGHSALLFRDVVPAFVPIAPRLEVVR